MLRSQGAEKEVELELMNVETDKWEISRDRIRLEEVIGSGTFGAVWRATLSRENGQPGIRFVAVKCFSRKYELFLFCSFFFVSDV